MFKTQSDVEDLYQRLFEDSSKSSAKSTLKSIHEVCKKLIQRNSTPTVSGIVTALGNQGIMISERTIYNRRGGKNPYPILIDAWIEMEKNKHSKVTQAVKNEDSIISDDELLTISDPVLRHKLLIMFGQFESLRKQNLALREIQQLPLISPDMKIEHKMDVSPKSELSTYHSEVINKFLNTSGNVKGLYFDENGTLRTKKPIRTGEALSELGLKDAIEGLLPKKIESTNKQTDEK